MTNEQLAEYKPELRREAGDAVKKAYHEGSANGVFNENDRTSKPGRFWCDSDAAKAAERIGGDHG